MLIRSQTLIFSSELPNRLIFCKGTGLRKFTAKAAKLKREVPAKIDREKLLESLSNTSIKPYLNTEKFDAVQSFLHRNKDVTCTYNFVADEAVAKNVTEKILHNTDISKTLIVEGNPGLGLITINLINSDASRMVVFDNSEMQDVCLTNLLQKYPDKLIQEKQNMNKNPEKIILSGFDFSKKLGLPWTFIGVATSFYFLRSLVLTVNKFELWDNNMDIYLLLSNRVLDTLKNGGSKLNCFVHFGFHLLYSIEDIAKYPQNAFLPYSEQGKGYMNLIRIKNNPNLFKTMTKEDLSEYFIFISILGSKWRNFIIKTLEKWLPGCGPHLISKGISMTSQIRDLTPDETLVLFKFFKECTGYQDFKVFSSEMIKKGI